MTAVAATIAFASPVVPALLQPYHDMHGFGGGMDLLSVGAAVLGGLFSLAILLLVVIVAWRLFRGDGAGAASGRAEPESPLEILERRYARGELEREDFLQKRDDLRQS